MQVDRYAHVPTAVNDAEADPHYLELRGHSAFPLIYLPPSMPGRHSRVAILTASVLIGVFALATTVGVCLTYGPQVLWR
jgi:hypothetical protein